jgi:enoyl-[acyl-carrier protein] reductase I
MKVLTGKRGIVFGIANDRSYAWFITKQLLEAGAKCAFTHLPGAKMENRCRLALGDLGLTHPWLMPCDVTKDQDLDLVFDRLREDFGKIDFIVHSVAYADRQFLEVGKFHLTSRAAWTQALEISAYSLLAMGQRSIRAMPDGGSIIAMTYYGGEKVIPGYNIMGVAKAALEHTTRYLAADLGPHKIRVNTISGGPLRTLAAAAVSGISEVFEHQRKRSALRRNIEGEEVGNTAVYLLSDLSSAVTGANIHVDAGFSIMGI